MRAMQVHLAALALALGAPVAAQAQAASAIPVVAAARAELLRDEERSPALPRVRIASENTRGAVIGFAIGAALGAAAGYAAFNGLCEAVDNRCEGSRPLWMVVGGLALGGVGALAGVLID